MRWVRHFVSKLKEKINIGSRPAHMNKSSSTMALRISRMHSTHPSSRVTKLTEGGMTERKPKPPCSVSTAEFNSLKYRNKTAYVKHISNGPKKLATSLVKVDLLNKTAKCDASALHLVIYVQACWRRAIAIRRFAKNIAVFRQKRQEEFEVALKNLKLLYPAGVRIIFDYIIKRLKNVNRHTKSVMGPYHRVSRQSKTKFTHFFKDSQLTQRMLENKYKSQTQNKLAAKVHILFDCAIRNEFDRLMSSGFVLTSKELNTELNGKTLLHHATRHNNLDFTKILLEGGANANAEDKESSRPLHTAFANKNFSIVFALLEYGGDLNLTNALGHTPLFYAPREFLGEMGLEHGVVTGSEALVDNNQLFYRMVAEIDDGHL